MSVELTQAELTGADGPDPVGSGRDARLAIVGSVLAELERGRERSGRAAVAPDTVASLVDEEYARYAHAPVRAFVPVLVRRAVLERVVRQS